MRQNENSLYRKEFRLPLGNVRLVSFLFLQLLLPQFLPLLLLF